MKDIKQRLNELLSSAENLINTRRTSPDDFRGTVDPETFYEFRSASLSFLANVFGSQHLFYTDFNSKVTRTESFYVKAGKGILSAAKQEIEGGWLFTVKSLISAEIFSDFLEMAEHLLDNQYKDSAAVMIGSILEEHLRQLCVKNSIDTNLVKDGKSTPKKSDSLNSELTSTSIYGKLDQKSVTAWLDLRNKAAHGRYSEYTEQQVKLMLQGVTDFIARTSSI